MIGTDGTFMVWPEANPPRMRVHMRKPQGPYKAGWQDITLPPQPRFVGDFKELARALKTGEPLKHSYDHELLLQETLLRASGEQQMSVRRTMSNQDNPTISSDRDRAAALLPFAAVRGTAANSAITVGLIGTGSRGTFVAGLMAKNTPARVVALCDIVDAKMEKATKSIGLRQSEAVQGLSTRCSRATWTR